MPASYPIQSGITHLFTDENHEYLAYTLDVTPKRGQYRVMVYDTDADKLHEWFYLTEQAAWAAYHRLIFLCKTRHPHPKLETTT